MGYDFEKFMGKNPDSDTKRLLGLREFEDMEESEKRELFKTQGRFEVFNKIDTSTMPRPKKREMKKNIVCEVLKNRLISEDLLKQFPTVYLGSGTSIEYPLALGGRDIILIDPILKEKESVDEIRNKIRNISHDEFSENKDEFRFNFDFGEGDEEVVVKIISSAYMSGSEILPEQIGTLILFAPQGPAGVIEIDSGVKKRLVDKGIILADADLIRIKGGEEKITKLGK